MSPEVFREKYNDLPSNPGVYRYYDHQHNLLYVGKAKNLKKRVSSYFNKTIQGYKTHELVRQIDRIEIAIVDSEQDAFFLENALIKAHQPKFNIDLKDDKSYPFIVIKKEPFPRIFLTRKKIKDGSEYLGPFTSVAKVRELLVFVKQHVQLRTCNLNLSEQNIERKKFKVCLEYHLGNCKGPCEGLQSAEDYEAGLQQVRQILKGKLSGVYQEYKTQMKQAAEDLAFERAEIIRKKLQHLEYYQAKSVIAGSTVGDADVFSLIRKEDIAFVNFLMVREGSIIQTHSQKISFSLDEPESEILGFAITRLRETFGSNASEIIVPFPVEQHDHLLTVTVARAGEKKRLLELSAKNATLYAEAYKQRQTLQLFEKDAASANQTLLEIKELLNLPEVPLHIECFDNSNFQGSFPVSAMVCFKNAAPSKADYRKFNVKTVEGINDFATMKEAVSRRYKRLLSEDQPLPQLVIIDGGKGQLSAAMEAIDSLELRGKMTVVGLAKNVEEIFFPGDTEALKLDYRSNALKLIRSIRDEVHRFGISFHRQKRSKAAIHNSLEDIPGIGKQTVTNLLKQFRSVKGIKNASLEDLSAVVGEARAQKIFAHFGITDNQN